MSLSSGYSAQTGGSSFGLPSDSGSSSQPTFQADTTPAEPAAPTQKPGGFSFDFTDPVKSLTGDIGSAGRLAESIIPFGDKIIPALGKGLGQIGDFLVPGDAGLGDVAKGIGTVTGLLSGPQQFIEEQAAKQRINYSLASQNPALAQMLNSNPLIGFLKQVPIAGNILESVQPKDLARAQNGEDIGKIAADMTDQGRGWSSNTTKELGAALLADPLNLVSGGLGKVAEAGTVLKVAQGAGETADLNPILRASGTAYNALTAGASTTVKSLVRGAIGPATSGIVKAYGAARYTGLLSSIGKEGSALRTAAEEYLGVNHTQVIRAAIGKATGRMFDPIVREAAGDTSTIEARLAANLANAQASPVTRKLVESDAEDIIRRSKLEGLAGRTDGEVYGLGVKYLQQTLGVSPEGAARILGSQTGKALKDTVGILHGMRYGRAVKDLVQIKNDLPLSRTGSLAVQADRLTPIAAGTATDKNVAEALGEIAHTTEGITPAAGLAVSGKGKAAASVAGETYDMNAVHQWVDRLDVLRSHFAGRAYTAEDVVRTLRSLQNSDGLVTELTKGLPAALKDWTTKYDYGVGYAPKSGWKATIEDGRVIVGDPFVHIQAGVTPTYVRNPIGRLGDSLFSSIHQRQLVRSSEFRLADMLVGKKVASESQAIGIHRAALREASDRRVTPRGLIDIPAGNRKYGNRLQEIFAEHLGDGYQEFIKHYSPEFAFLTALKGYASEVGYSQYLTGSLKAAEQKILGTHLLVSITEDLYSKARFLKNPFFQLQERIETATWKAVRGVVHQDMDPIVRDAATQAIEGSPEGKLFEEFGPIFLHGGEAVASDVVNKTGIAGRLKAIGANVTNVAGTKREATIQQVFKEYPEQVRSILVDQAPGLWREMEKAAASTDAQAVIEHWVKGQQAAMDATKLDAELAIQRKAIQTAYDNGETALGQQLNREAGIAQGGSVESGGAVKASAPKAAWNADTETIYQAWRYGLQRTAQVAKQTQYFREGRGWLERGLNHPFLGLYPLSYATKVMMEFGRFLLKRPFGLNAPLVGAAAMNKFQQAVLTEMSDKKSGLAGFVKANPIAVNFINQMLPYWPTDVGVNAPLWVKDIAGQAEAGKKVSESARTKKGQNVTPQDIGTALLNQSKLYLAAPLRLPLEVLPGSLQQGFDSTLGSDPTLGGAH